jgi:hypothetical protein
MGNVAQTRDSSSSSNHAPEAPRKKKPKLRKIRSFGEFSSARSQQDGAAGGCYINRLAAEAHLAEAEGLALVAASSRGGRGFFATRRSGFNRASATVAAAVATAARAIAVAAVAAAAVATVATAVATAAAVARLGRAGVVGHQGDTDDRQESDDAEDQGSIHSSTSKEEDSQKRKWNVAADSCELSGGIPVQTEGPDNSTSTLPLQLSSFHHPAEKDGKLSRTRSSGKV